jgi:hypothetical protein
MYSNRWRNEWSELAIISVVSFVLYQMNMLVLFCIPLQVLYIRRGERSLLYAGTLVLAAIGIAGLVRTAPVEDMAFRRGLLLIEVMLPAFFLAGLMAVDFRWRAPVRTLNRVLAVAIVAGIVSIPLILRLGRSENFSELIRAQVDAIVGIFQTGAGSAGDLLPDTERLVELILGLLLRNYVFAYYLTLVGSIWVGRAIAGRMHGNRVSGLRDLHLPDWMIWAFLVPWALVLLDLKVDIGSVRYAAWNIGLMMLFTYGMQGVGILQTVLDRRRVPRGLRVLLTCGLMLMVLWPGVNLIVLIGLPCLGVSELWIHFRKEQKEREDYEDR